ncbi:MAG TPA: hypothetical protein VF603_14170 [Allosphingosinicella sp.]
MGNSGKLVLLAGAAALAGCGSQAGGNNAQAGAQASPGAGLAGQPVREEHRSLALTPQWLAGRWTDDGDCGAGDTFLTFAPDGTYGYMEEAGRWSLQGSALTIEITTPAPDGGGQAGEKNTSQVKPIGPNEAEILYAEGQEPSRLFRCHEG